MPKLPTSPRTPRTTPTTKTANGGLSPLALAPSDPRWSGAIETTRPTMLISALRMAAEAFERDNERGVSVDIGSPDL
jgi:hypothetical protein